jgi:hypothetical protein
MHHHRAMAALAGGEHEAAAAAVAWPEFERRWSELRNFLVAGEVTRGFGGGYRIPPLERIIEEVRADQSAIFRSGVKQAAFDRTDVSDEFRALPVAEALRSRFILAHFDLHGSLGGPGQVFEGLEEAWVEPWRGQLRQRGFTFDSVFSILFAAGPHSATNYHMDHSHQLAWQQYGEKHWHGLTEPDHWTTHQQRCDTRSHGLKMVRPAALMAAAHEAVYTVVQPPGSVLWNPHTTPHWVETFAEPALTLTLVHRGLRLNGKLCPHEQECEAAEDDKLGVNPSPSAAAVDTDDTKNCALPAPRL